MLKEHEDLTELRERTDHQEDQDQRDQTEQREIAVQRGQMDQLADPEAEEASDLLEQSVNEDLKDQWEWLEVQESPANVDHWVTKEMMVLVDQQVPVDPWEFQEMVD